MERSSIAEDWLHPFDYMVENEKGVSIDNTFYDYDEVKQIFEKYWVNRED